MMPALRAPRLLPVTIAVLALVLVAKSTLLVRSAIDSERPAAIVASAWAGGPDAPPAPAKPDSAAKPQKPAPAAVKPPGAVDVPEGPAPMTDGEKAVLLDLRARREQLDAREAAVANRESMLVAAEKKLSARVEELQGLQQRLESLDAGRKQQDEVAWQGLVKVYEDMKPRDAAAIFNDLGMPVLLGVVERMKEAKAAAVLAAMVPDKARDVTTQIAQKRTKAAAAAESGDKPAGNPGAGKAPGSGT
jgi:flagellar motility protein MotE (MotC chaperone)